ncbi:MAG: aminoacyl-tRNA hydrolase [Oscillospiraceae bacterium]|jgi:PTH1 family peptidyl-tRNA hydrolase|nr:aminoacyl-tRNA hydrolase [Oscillospiraceae bacterium]
MFSFFKKKSINDKAIEFAVFGLGNPGIKYENTPHNAGFLAIDHIIEKEKIKSNFLKFKSLCAEATLEGKHVLLVKPQTFMNLSGQAVTSVMETCKLPPENILLIFDDIHLNPGRMRIRRNGSAGGHNGIKNIIYLSGKDAFPRIKIGIGAKPNSCTLADWVTSGFSPQTKELLDLTNEKVYHAVKLIISRRINEAMNLYN